MSVKIKQLRKASKEEKGASKAPTLVEEGLMGPAIPQGTLPINPVPNVTNLVNNYSSFIHMWFFFFLHSFKWTPVPCFANSSALLFEICFVRWV